jgi:hypothetical protein
MQMAEEVLDEMGKMEKVLAHRHQRVTRMTLKMVKSTQSVTTDETLSCIFDKCCPVSSRIYNGVKSIIETLGGEIDQVVEDPIPFMKKVFCTDIDPVSRFVKYVDRYIKMSRAKSLEIMSSVPDSGNTKQNIINLMRDRSSPSHVYVYKKDAQKINMELEFLSRATMSENAMKVNIESVPETDILGTDEPAIRAMKLMYAKQQNQKKTLSNRIKLRSDYVFMTKKSTKVPIMGKQVRMTSITFTDMRSLICILIDKKAKIVQVDGVTDEDSNDEISKVLCAVVKRDIMKHQRMGFGISVKTVMHKSSESVEVKNMFRKKKMLAYNLKAIMGVSRWTMVMNMEHLCGVSSQFTVMSDPYTFSPAYVAQMNNPIVDSYMEMKHTLDLPFINDFMQEIHMTSDFAIGVVQKDNEMKQDYSGLGMDVRDLLLSDMRLLRSVVSMPEEELAVPDLMQDMDIMSMTEDLSIMSILGELITEEEEEPGLDLDEEVSFSERKSMVDVVYGAISRYFNNMFSININKVRELSRYLFGQPDKFWSVILTDVLDTILGISENSELDKDSPCMRYLFMYAHNMIKSLLKVPRLGRVFYLNFPNLRRESTILMADVEDDVMRFLMSIDI